MTESISVLVIDDDPAIRRAVRAGVEDLGWSCLEAADGRDGLRLLDSEPVTLVVSDVWMPHMDGIAFAREACARRPGLKILAISGGGVAPAALSVKMAQMYGARSVLYKPFTTEELQERLASLAASGGDGG